MQATAVSANSTLVSSDADNFMPSASSACPAPISTPEFEEEPQSDGEAIICTNNLDPVSSPCYTDSQFVWSEYVSAKAESREPEKKFATCGTQWSANETGDALLLHDHIYSCVQQGNLLPVSCETISPDFQQMFWAL